MNPSLDIASNARPVGYGWLREKYGLDPLPHHVRSFVGSTSERQKIEKDGIVSIVLPKRTAVREDWLGHLEFAVKNEGIDLNLMRGLFGKVDPSALVSALEDRSTGKYLRKIWYLYEAITEQKLLLPDLVQGNYVDLLDKKHYFTGSRSLVPRQRINRNLLGGIDFCGVVRRTAKLQDLVAADLAARCEQVIGKYPEEVFERAMNYLYRKETKSSFEIESETPDQKKSGKFVALLREAGKGNFLDHAALTGLQNWIVDSRFANERYRDETGEQIYVGQSAGLGKDIVHFVGPKPEDTAGLMVDWMNMSRVLSDTEDLHPVIAAAITAFGFVFVHPFSDGNGRIHRFLIHHMLARMGFAPRNVVFPVSAVMLKRPGDYDAALESFSIPLMERVEYELDGLGRMTVLNETDDFYRAIDYTLIAEKLFEFVAETIETELPEEFDFLESYDKARQGMKAVVELPDRLADLFIRLVVQNHGTLSGKKRQSLGFEKLTDDEVAELERVVGDAFDLATES